MVKRITNKNPRSLKQNEDRLKKEGVNPNPECMRVPITRTSSIHCAGSERFSTIIARTRQSCEPRFCQSAADAAESDVRLTAFLRHNPTRLEYGLGSDRGDIIRRGAQSRGGQNCKSGINPTGPSSRALRLDPLSLPVATMSRTNRGTAACGESKTHANASTES